MSTDDEESREGFLNGEKTPPRYENPRTKLKLLTPFTCALTLAVISSSLCVVLLAYIATHPLSPDHRRPEELAHPLFPLLPRTFTGGLKYDAHGALYRDAANEHTSYTGNTSSVAAAWRQYDAVQTIALDPAEVNIDGLFTDARGKILTIPDVFHQLHCLNQIRTALYDPAYLSPLSSDEPDNANAKRQMHVDHCVDYLRQIIECRADLTPLRLFWSEGAGRMMVDFEGTHTCRDFEAVLGWAWDHHVRRVDVP